MDGNAKKHGESLVQNNMPVAKERVEITSVQDTPATNGRRKTYSQNWPAYNKAEVYLGDLFPAIASKLVKVVRQPDQTKGRPRLPLHDILFACIYGIYCNKSGRKIESDLRAAQRQGYIYSVPPYNTISRYMRNPALTPILTDLITVSAAPLEQHEDSFAVDSTGFSTSNFIRWFNKKYGKETDNREWVKFHFASGVNTNIISAVQVSGWNAHDTTFFAPLVGRTAQAFPLSMVLADKAYLSRKNLEIARSLGATAYIPFKSNTVQPERDGSAWSDMYYEFSENHAEWKRRYTKRNNVETSVSMMKKVQWYALRSRIYEAQVNEALCKALCHNIVVLIHSMFGLDIKIEFGHPMKESTVVSGMKSRKS